MKREERRRLVAQQLEVLPKANKAKTSDGSARFKLVGGKYHNIVIRAYAPWEPIEFPNGDRYEYSDEPINQRSKAHTYMWVSGPRPT